MAVFTKEEIRELFSENNKAIAENNKAIAELRESQKKTDAQIAENNKAIAETRKAIAELAVSQKKTDEQIAKTSREISELRESQKKTDEQLAKTDAQLANLGVKMDKMNERYGGLSNNVGSATEEFFYNVLNKKRTLNGIRFDHVYRNWRKKGHEFDIVMENGTAISVIEVKLKAHKDDIEKILTKQKKRFNEIFPEYKDYEQHWALATFSIDDELRKKAQASGLTVLCRDGELLEYNPPTRPEGIQLIGA